jgi:REP element-mobilizing transposase RayT
MKGLEIFSWVIMTNHVHLIVSSNKDPLENIFRDMKRHTSSKLKKLIVSNQFESRHLWITKLMIGAGNDLSHNRGWQFWQQVTMPIEIRNQRSFYEISDYIHKNPVKAGFVEKEEDWRYSSARDFYGKKGLIELSYIE